MIRDAQAYARLRCDEEQRALAALDADESIAIAEQLWTSSVANEVRFPDEPRPQSLAILLRIAPARSIPARRDPAP